MEQPVTVAIDDTLFRRRGKRVWAASWFHDGSAQGPAKTGYGNNWVVLAVRVRAIGLLGEREQERRCVHLGAFWA